MSPGIFHSLRNLLRRSNKITAVPDPPNVFAYLEEDNSDSEEDHDGPHYEEHEDEDHEEDHEDHDEDHDEDHEEEDDDSGSSADDDDDDDDEANDVVYNDIHPHPGWLSHPLDSDPTTPMQPHFTPSSTPSISSASSSVHSSFSSDHPADADADTDRSTSPELSIKGSPSPPPPRSLPSPPSGPPDTRPDPAAAKVAAQMLAAQHRQSLHSTNSPYSAPPPMPRVPSSYPPSHPGSQALSPRFPGHISAAPPPRSHPRPQPPVTGYEALAAALSSSSPSPSPFAADPPLRPLYRRFSTLNHRLLLHLQDELSELETALHNLDAADTAARTHPSSTATSLHIRPASRRAAAAAGGEMEWHKLDLLNRISLKLNTYNETLRGFQGTAGLRGAERAEVEAYTTYLREKRPVVESETAFLAHADDLVALGPAAPSSADPSPPPHLDTSTGRQVGRRDQSMQTLVLAVAASILVPILTFSVIPNFAGRMAVALLVAVGVLGIVAQADGGVRGLEMGMGMGARERVVCAGLWAVGMAVVGVVVG